MRDRRADVGAHRKEKKKKRARKNGNEERKRELRKGNEAPRKRKRSESSSIDRFVFDLDREKKKVQRVFTKGGGSVLNHRHAI